MTYKFPSSNHNLDRVMRPEQFNKVVEAITARRYSWACVLILGFAGYNPLHYIPYRTYIRLVKESRQLEAANESQASQIEMEEELSENNYEHTNLSQSFKIDDLGYLETLNHKQASPQGGSFQHWLNNNARKYLPVRLQSLLRDR
ncbi:HetP family heterocyst commitment protein [Brunnivagina elsteri]|uniref:Heterocyst differentiation protein n=1 Tax=Brunnivagina elsteri CCALA 953 TaxID=987040 RepID=A0A2A2TJT4_9CYAN|nr:HetP family heterocyst commitment protein [Calothrix elsteri]PAX55876.1 heterocyst differentiation protein [Calothrix elsteri CCALA 953]